MEFLTERDVVMVEGGGALRRSSQRAHDAGKQWFDDLVAQYEVGTRGSHAAGVSDVAPRVFGAME
jgi:hypothetical protein